MVYTCLGMGGNPGRVAYSVRPLAPKGCLSLLKELRAEEEELLVSQQQQQEQKNVSEPRANTTDATDLVDFNSNSSTDTSDSKVLERKEKSSKIIESTKSTDTQVIPAPLKSDVQLLAEHLHYLMQNQYDELRAQQEPGWVR